MSKSIRALAFDCGSSNGRIIAGDFDGKRLKLTELSRFPNAQEEMGGTRYWNVMRMWQELKLGIRNAASKGKFDSISTDSWGCDFALLRPDGRLLQDVIGYRDDSREQDLAEANSLFKSGELYQKAGVYYFSNSVVPVLRAVIKKFPRFLDYAEVLLNLPDFFNYLLSGEKCGEFTIASTNQLLDPRTGQYHREVLETLGLPERIFLPPVLSGHILGKTKKSLEQDLDIRGVKVIATCGHDSAAALAAVPAADDGDWICVSSGSWSVLMCEIDKPLPDPGEQYRGFLHEGAYGGKYRLVYNQIGLWLIQELRRSFGGISFDAMDSLAEKVPAYKSIIIPQHYRVNVPDLPGSMREYCRKTNQPVPETEGELIRCAYDSAALNSAIIIGKMEKITGRVFKRIHVVSGGTHSSLMLQGIADITGKEVVAGPQEAAAIGNILVQLIALGELSSLNEGRRLVKEAFAARSYFPSASYAPDLEYYTGEMYNKVEMVL
ncbi:MAG: hypothetical protein LBQ88_12515 [Treponema sp.]|jgi:rhamnulokinase/L-fuculokinase|nr:hypothetical protein [Treponema sp.]